MNDLILALYLVNESLMRLAATAAVENRPELVAYARERACELLKLIGQIVVERAQMAGQYQPPVKA